MDPFAAIKRAEWQPAGAPAALQQVLSRLPAGTHDALAALLAASLWGNRVDLSYRAVLPAAGGHPDGQLLVDDREQVHAFLGSRSSRLVVLIADNVGTEQLMDLALVDLLLDHGLASEVEVHVKPQPFFVSDTTLPDVPLGLDAAAHGGPAGAALAQRCRQYQAEARLRFVTHWAYATCLYFYQVPQELFEQWGRAALVIIKGDANFRRLVGDLHWPPTTPFQRAAGYFPAPLVALRTLKAPLALGLAETEVARLNAEDPDWRINGRRGVIQALGLLEGQL
jgi:uncharacterized protein with ATP-grasp and redox domains